MSELDEKALSREAVAWAQMHEEVAVKVTTIQSEASDWVRHGYHSCNVVTLYRIDDILEMAAKAAADAVTKRRA